MRTHSSEIIPIGLATLHASLNGKSCRPKLTTIKNSISKLTRARTSPFQRREGGRPVGNRSRISKKGKTPSTHEIRLAHTATRKTKDGSGGGTVTLLTKGVLNTSRTIA